MNIVYIGSFYPTQLEEKIRNDSKASLDYAANNFQWALITGLEMFFPKLTLVSLPNIFSFPFNYKKFFFKGSNFKHNDNESNCCLSFVNIPFLKLFSKKNRLYNWLEKNIDVNHNNTTILIYGVHTPFLKAVIDFKKKYSNIKVCLVVPDLPKYMSGNRGTLHLLFKRFDHHIINSLLRDVDSFVLLNKLMEKSLNLNGRPWRLVEGIYNSNEYVYNNCEKEDNRTILYTGNIDERYGLKLLIDSFRLIKKENYRLWIRGGGNTLAYIKEAAKQDPRIVYFEQMSKSELVNLQKRATVLINPVSSKEEFTKYFFPSKTMDYLASSTPTIMTRIEGVPNEYFNYVYIIEKEDEEGYKDKLIEVCEKNNLELKDFGDRAAKFIVDNKNHIIQVGKIHKMICEV